MPLPRALRAAFILWLCTTPALAGMDGASFEARTTGKTLTFTEMGSTEPYGAEQYLPGRRVIWSFLEGDCVEGRWYEQQGEICFAYENDLMGEQCWSFEDAPNGQLVARFLGVPETAPLISVRESPEPLICPGPRVGA